ncbi:hypothetical protein BJX61DRAFT_533174 [Aspergillus egyptiacus]|nr:hypothetical protein BJX61DRAFT_533174 [Aspergillus egyptiacus]
MSLLSTSTPKGRPCELLFQNVKPNDGTLICQSFDGHAETERRCARINYNLVTGILRVKVMPVSLHDIHQRYIVLAFDQFSGIYRVDTDPLPRIILESGWSASFPSLREDKDVWLLGDPSVVLVMLLQWTAVSNGRVKDCAEVWRRDTLGSRVSSTVSILPAPSPLPPAETIQFTKGELFGAALVLGADPNKILELDVAELRGFAEEAVKRMNMHPA